MTATEPRSARQRPAGRTRAQTTPDGALGDPGASEGPQTGNVVPIRPVYIAVRITHNGDDYALCQWPGQDRRYWGEVPRANDDDPDKKPAPIAWCDLTVTGIGRVHEFDRATGRIHDSHTGHAYTLALDDPDTGARSTFTVHARDLVAGARAYDRWLAQSGLDIHVRGNRRSRVADLIYALAHGHRIDPEDPSHSTRYYTGAVVPMVTTTGPVTLDEDVIYVPAVGQAFDRHGPTDAIRSDPSGRPRAHLADVAYRPERPSWDDPATLRAAHALRRVITAHGDRGLSGALTGQQIGALTAGRRLGGRIGTTGTVSYLVGPSMSGKTTFALLLTSSQTRNLYGIVKEPNTCIVARGNTAGGMKPTGAAQYLRDNGGALALMDDVGPKALMDDRHKMEQHVKILGAVVNSVMGGGPLQGTVDNVRNRVDLAESLDARLSVVGTAETFAPVPSLVDDGVANRVCALWWNSDDRCDPETLSMLQSEAETLARNDGLRACLQILLEGTGTLEVGYVRAFDALTAAEVPPRLATNYARMLAGLAVLDRVYERCGVLSDLLGECLPGVVEHARRMMEHGTVGGADEVVVGDPVEAFRMAFGVLARQERRLLWDFGPADADVIELPAPPEPAQLPPGRRPEDFGWTTAEYDGRSVRAGRCVPKPRNGRHEFKWRGEMRPADWSTVCAMVGAVCRREGWRTGTADETRRALESAGVLIHRHTRSGSVYQINMDWLTTVPDDTDDPEESDD